MLQKIKIRTAKKIKLAPLKIRIIKIVKNAIMLKITVEIKINIEMIIVIIIATITIKLITNKNNNNFILIITTINTMKKIKIKNN